MSSLRLALKQSLQESSSSLKKSHHSSKGDKKKNKDRHHHLHKKKKYQRHRQHDEEGNSNNNASPSGVRRGPHDDDDESGSGSGSSSDEREFAEGEEEDEDSSSGNSSSDEEELDDEEDHHDRGGEVEDGGGKKKRDPHHSQSHSQHSQQQHHNVKRHSAANTIQDKWKKKKTKKKEAHHHSSSSSNNAHRQQGGHSHPEAFVAAAAAAASSGAAPLASSTAVTSSTHPRHNNSNPSVATAAASSEHAEAAFSSKTEHAEAKKPASAATSSSSLLSQSRAASPKALRKKQQQQQQQQSASGNDSKTDSKKEKKSSSGSSSKSKTVPPPDAALVAWMRQMSVSEARAAIRPGLRVKVRFATSKSSSIADGNSNKDNTNSNKRRKKWFGGRVSAVSKEGSKVRIMYDDRTKEVTRFPDVDVIVDDAWNGTHEVSAEAFLPPTTEEEEEDEQKVAAAPASPPPLAAVQKRLSPSSLSAKAAAAETKKSDGKKAAAATDDHQHHKRKREHSGDNNNSAPSSPSAVKATVLAAAASSVAAATSTSALSAATAAGAAALEDTPKPKRKRGRPPKHRPPVVDVAAAPEATASTVATTVTATATGSNTEKEVGATPLLFKKKKKKHKLAAAAAAAAAASVVGAVESNLALSVQGPTTANPPALEASEQLQRQPPKEHLQTVVGETTAASSYKDSNAPPPPFSNTSTDTRMDVDEMVVQEQQQQQPPHQQMEMDVDDSSMSKTMTTTMERRPSDSNMGATAPPPRQPSLTIRIKKKVEDKDASGGGTGGLLSSNDYSSAIAAVTTTSAVETASSNFNALRVTDSNDDDKKNSKLPWPPLTEQYPETAAESLKMLPTETQQFETVHEEEPATVQPVKRLVIHIPGQKRVAQSKSELGDVAAAADMQSKVTSTPGELTATGVSTPTEEDDSRAAPASLYETTEPSRSLPLKKKDSREISDIDAKARSPRPKKKRKRLEGAEPNKRRKIDESENTFGGKSPKSPSGLRKVLDLNAAAAAAISSTANDDTTTLSSVAEALMNVGTGAATAYLPPENVARNNAKGLEISLDAIGMTEEEDSTTGKPLTPHAESHTAGNKQQHDDNAPAASDDAEAEAAAAAAAAAASVFRSGRRAAREANERIASRQELVIPEVSKKKKKLRGEHQKPTGVDGAESPEDDSQWVQCDKCGKWRIIPSIVVNMLPKQWYCADNIWDSKRASCDAPEQTAKQATKEKKRRKKLQQRLILAAAAEAAAAETAAAAAAAAASVVAEEGGEGAETGSEEEKPRERERARSPRPRDDADATASSSVKPSSKRASPEVPEQVSDAPIRSEKKGSSALGKKGRTESIEALATLDTASSIGGDVPVVKPSRGRGRPRRNAQPKESVQRTSSSTDVTTIPTSSSGQPQSESNDNLEWVQCEKCEKWRKLPSAISAEELPDVWFCSLNTWNPTSASCDAPEDKADGLQDIGFHSGGAGSKLSYRNLIFGSTGRKANRPVSERTRASESLFLAPNDDEDAPPVVMYANSSAFVSRGRNQMASDENDSISVLGLMSHSNLWKELRNGAQQWNGTNVISSPDTTTSRGVEKQNNFSFHTFDTLPLDVRQSTKDLILHALGEKTLHSDQVVLEAQHSNTENMPDGWSTARSYCTTNVVVTALCELVRDGTLECLQKMGPEWTVKDWNPRYRRVKPRQPSVETQDTPRPAAEAHKASRCMKIAKPWKRARVH